jgi:hypothetical protein
MRGGRWRLDRESVVKARLHGTAMAKGVDVAKINGTAPTPGRPAYIRVLACFFGISRRSQTLGQGCHL